MEYRIKNSKIELTILPLKINFTLNDENFEKCFDIPPPLNNDLYEGYISSEKTSFSGALQLFFRGQYDNIDIIIDFDLLNSDHIELLDNNDSVTQLFNSFESLSISPISQYNLHKNSHIIDTVLDFIRDNKRIFGPVENYANAVHNKFIDISTIEDVEQQITLQNEFAIRYDGNYCEYTRYLGGDIRSLYPKDDMFKKIFAFSKTHPHNPNIFNFIELDKKTKQYIEENATISRKGLSHYFDTLKTCKRIQKHLISRNNKINIASMLKFQKYLVAGSSTLSILAYLLNCSSLTHLRANDIDLWEYSKDGITNFDEPLTDTSFVYAPNKKYLIDMDLGEIFAVEILSSKYADSLEHLLDSFDMSCVQVGCDYNGKWLASWECLYSIITGKNIIKTKEYRMYFSTSAKRSFYLTFTNNFGITIDCGIIDEITDQRVYLMYDAVDNIIKTMAEMCYGFIMLIITMYKKSYDDFIDRSETIFKDYYDRIRRYIMMDEVNTCDLNMDYCSSGEGLELLRNILKPKTKTIHPSPVEDNELSSSFSIDTSNIIRNTQIFVIPDNIGPFNKKCENEGINYNELAKTVELMCHHLLEIGHDDHDETYKSNILFGFLEKLKPMARLNYRILKYENRGFKSVYV